MPNNEYRVNIWQGEFPKANSKDDGFAGTCPVDQFKQNNFGFYNMVGNVWEWTADWFTASHSSKPQNNPVGGKNYITYLNYKISLVL